MPSDARAAAILTIDVEAIVANWRRLAEACAPRIAAGAVVKADAYGLGADVVATALVDAGCKTLFVAHLDEGIRLRARLPRTEIIVFHGATGDTEGDFMAHGLIPVLNGPDQIARWSAYARATPDGGPVPAVLHVDTGMARLGLAPAEAARLYAHPQTLAGIRLVGVMSHLACADEPAHPLNEAQRQAFADIVTHFPGVRASLANSSGVLLGAGWHFDLIRPGAALYGVNPRPGQANPMRPVVTLNARVLQVRDVDSPQTVGYGATYRVTGNGRIATVAVGYADGYFRALGGRATAMLGGVCVPLVGRVSMDLATFDVSAVPVHLAVPGAMVTLIGPDHDVDALAAEAGTIGYEVLTALGTRYHRRYTGAVAGP